VRRQAQGIWQRLKRLPSWLWWVLGGLAGLWLAMRSGLFSGGASSGAYTAGISPYDAAALAGSGTLYGSDAAGAAAPAGLDTQTQAALDQQAQAYSQQLAGEQQQLQQLAGQLQQQQGLIQQIQSWMGGAMQQPTYASGPAVTPPAPATTAPAGYQPGSFAAAAQELQQLSAAYYRYSAQHPGATLETDPVLAQLHAEATQVRAAYPGAGPAGGYTKQQLQQLGLLP
jgi:uncharacterized phage infection (PIP) family protein YhgE